MNEQAAFEANIDANPLDASNHLVYADWLDENGQPEEAAFRRAMGEWVGRGPDDYRGRDSLVPAGSSFRDYSRPAQEHIGRGEGEFSIRTENLPEWGAGIPQSVEYHEVPHMAHTVGTRHYWQSYRDMEEGLRQAFMKGLKDQPKKLSRRIAARRYMRSR